MMFRLIYVVCLALIIYIAFSINTMKQIETKKDELTSTLVSARTELSKIDGDYTVISDRINAYSTLIDSINNLSDSENSDANNRIIPQKAIPNLLNKIMFAIPQKVQITSIKNTEGVHVVIEAQSEKYEQLGYFKAVLDTKGILVNVKSTSGMKDKGIVKVTIEGDLP